MEQGRFLFKFMAFLFVAVVFASVALQSVFSQKDKSVRQLNAQSIRLDKNIADARDEFSRLIRIEVLQSAASGMFPNFKNIKFDNRISVSDLQAGDK